MNETENKFEATGDLVNDDLYHAVQSLRSLLSLSLVVLIMFSLCVDVFLFKQGSLLNGQTAVTLTQTEEIFSTAKASDLWSKLNEFAKTHPDYETVIAKYRPVVSKFTAATAPTAAK